MSARRGRVRRLWGVGALCVLAIPPRTQAQTAAPSVTWRPPQALEGVLAEVVVRSDSRAAPIANGVTGAVAGEPLHFEALGERVVWALVPVPLDSPDTLTVTFMVSRGAGSTDTIVARRPVRHRPPAMQVLELPAPFNRPPDAAAGARLATEAAVLDTIWQRTHDRPRLWHESFLRPVPGRVTTAFGVARRIAGMLEPRHRGVDLAGATGTAVRVANRGIVELASPLYAGGLTVVVDHGAGLVTSYGHLSRATVEVGDTVGRGQVIGRVGASGRVTGPHLHWAAFYGMLPVDPLSLLALNGHP